MRKKTKFLLLRSTIVLLFTILAGRIWYVQVVMGSYYRTQGDTSKIRNQPVQSLRGVIYDRNGRQIVWNEPSWNVSIVPHGIPGSQAKLIYAQVSQALHGNPSPAEIANMVWNHRFVPYAAVVIKQNVSDAAAMLIMQKHRELPGIRADLSTVRQYAVDSQFSLSHLLGYTSKISGPDYNTSRATYPLEHFGLNDQMGRDGIELSLDPYLHGVNGTQQVEVDSGERPIRTIRRAVTVPGDNVYLTINWKLQQQVAADLSAALAKLNLHQGAAVVEDVHSGQILAMVSLPSYNDNWFAGGISFSRYNSLLHAPGKPLNDLAAGSALPPGSTYKVITAAAALQTHVADVNRYIDDTGMIKLCNVYYPAAPCQRYFGWLASGLGPVNVVSALAKSSDIYFYTVAGGDPNKGALPYVGARRLRYYARLFGLGSPTGIELPNDAQGLVPNVAQYGSAWHIGDTYNMAIGQGSNLASPLQMVNVAATIANGGTLYHPKIVQRIVGRLIPRRGVLHRTQVIEPFVPSIARQHFINPYNLSLIQQGMHDSVSWGLAGGGTSFAVTDKRIDAAGKTGTAEVAGQTPHAWWIGYAPFNHPKIAVSVVVPHANAEGAYVAAPIAHKIFEDYFHLPSNKPNWLDDVRQELVGGGGGAQ